MGAASTTANAQSVGISVVPTIERVQWNDRLAFANDDLYGGRLALQFGRFVELQPYYFTRDGYGIDSETAAERFGPRAVGQELDIRHYGSNVQINFASARGNLIPFIRAGAGVLRLIPDSTERQDRITLSAGGGVRFGIGGLNAELFAEQMSFRMRPMSLYGGPDTSTGKPPTLRNLVYGAAITVPLSGSRETLDTDPGLHGTSAPIEPFVGVLRYDSSFNLDDLELAGVRAGIDFSPIFGVRGFYWRGVNEDRDGPAAVSGYGGEGQFNLSKGTGISPFLVVGAGKIDYKEEFRDSTGYLPEDQNVIILGGGASVHLTDRIRVNGAIRDYVMSRESELDNVASTTDLTHNPMVTAGLTISFGKGSADVQSSDAVRAARNSANGTSQIDRRDEELRMLREALADRERRLNSRESGMMTSDRDQRVMMIERNLDTMRAGGASGRWITVPVPEQGEIILRYGMTPSTDSAGRVIVQPSAAAPAGSAQANVDVANRLLEIERRLNARLDAIERRQQGLPAAAQPGTPNVSVNVDQEGVRDRANTPVFQRLTTTRSRDLSPYVGFGFGDDNTQLILGARANLGPLTEGSPLDFVPELAIGLGDGTSVLAMANVRYSLNATSFNPYFTFGGGIFTPSVLGVNTAIGSSFALQKDTANPWHLGVELQGINLFSHTRLLFSLTRNP